MYPDNIIRPVPLKSQVFLDQRGESLSRFTLAAFLLLSGALFVEDERHLEDRLDLPTSEELEFLGINAEVRETVPRGAFNLRQFSVDDSDNVPSSALASLAAEVNERGNPRDAARLVALGCNSSDELVRICALGSAVDFFRLETINIHRQLVWFFDNALDLDTFELLFVLMARVFQVAAMGNLSPPTNVPTTTPTGLMAVHGTVLPYSQANRPEWSVPPKGSLFSHIKTFRNDIYGSPDFFRWEGGYTDYAREVAINSLCDWINRRSLNGIDVVAHSHGCNVVMGSTSISTNFRKIVMLSCPVHWGKYSLPAAMITNDVVSIRTRFDFVIMMDRGGQRFPNGTIKDVILPFWFTSHSSTTKPNIWRSQNLDQYLR
ncbi:hypothetical protein [Gluconobacter cerinus]|uniref:hypothetical protein n=1 Tax=Gluconobacter cerinus TaxID=38307 RepID=UPI000C068299|nr:hypothetical protein [Gluconobacter cerinus]